MNRILGLDIGKKRIGIAISDVTGIIAIPVETILREPEIQSVLKIKEICLKNSVKTIVAGLPKNMNNTIGEQAQDCLKYMENFKSDFNVVLEDERLTSKQAEYILAQTGRKYTKNKQLVDLKSACIILQQYIDKKGE